MDFLDNAIEKTKEVLDVACKKTGEVVANEKQRFDIASLKSKQEKDFAALGRLCFEMFGDLENCPDEFKGLIAEIKSKDARILKLSEEMAAAKQKQVCPKCLAEIDKKAVFCSKCGEKLNG